MFFFFHLFAGIIIGLILTELFNDKRWILPVVIGAIIPDLVDKPLGYILFSDILGNGRIFFHSLLFFFIFVLIGIIIWKKWSNPVIFALAIGIFSHQLLDQMWKVPISWFYPLLGTFAYHPNDDIAFTLLSNDLGSISEWIIILGILGVATILILLKKDSLIIRNNCELFSNITLTLSLSFLIISGISIGIGLTFVKHRIIPFFQYLEWSTSAQYFMGGIIFLLTAYECWRLHKRIDSNEEIFPY